MNDLIDREDAIKLFLERKNELAGIQGDLGGAMSGAAKLIESLPSAEPKKGKWIPHSEKSREYIGTALVNVEYDYWFCDTCGYRVENGQPIYNFCPHCGADMRSGKEERWTKNSLKKDEKY